MTPPLKAVTSVRARTRSFSKSRRPTFTVKARRRMAAARPTRARGRAWPRSVFLFKFDGFFTEDQSLGVHPIVAVPENLEEKGDAAMHGGHEKRRIPVRIAGLTGLDAVGLGRIDLDVHQRQGDAPGHGLFGGLLGLVQGDGVTLGIEDRVAPGRAVGG